MKIINKNTEQRTIDYVLHWGEPHELFNEAYEENKRRNPQLYTDYCYYCNEESTQENDGILICDKH